MGVRQETRLLFVAAAFGAVGALTLHGAVARWADGDPSWSLSLYGCLAAACLAGCLACVDMWRLQPADSHTVRTLLLQYGFLWMLRGISLYARFYVSNITHNPQRENRASLQNILEKNKNSSYGKEYNFSQMHSREDFVRLHPLTTPEHFAGYMARVAAGEANVLYPGPTQAIICTSGTTGRPKRYAWRPEYVSALKFSFSLSFCCSVPYRLLNLQRSVHFHLASPLSTTSGGVTTGTASQVLYMHLSTSILPAAYGRLYTEDASFYAQAIFTLAEREVLYLGGFSADLMYSYWKFISENWERLCDDISAGHIGRHIESMPEDIREEMSTQLVADPARAAELRAAAKMGMVGLARRIWPGMGYVTLGKSAAFQMCAGLLMESYLAGVKVFGMFHGASEGITGFNVEQEDAHVGETLTLIPYPECFAEFIPLQQVDEEKPSTVFLEQLQVGSKYEVVHTNLNGLYRCRYGDVIQVVGFTNNTAKYKLLYKLGQRLNVAYERTPDCFLFSAIKACRPHLPPGVNIVNYTTTESVAIEKITGRTEKGHYVFFVELDVARAVSCLDFASQVDVELSSQYALYRRYKDSGSIGPLSVVQVRPGTFEGLKWFVWSGTPHTQFKMPRVLRDAPALGYLLQQAV